MVLFITTRGKVCCRKLIQSEKDSKYKTDFLTLSIGTKPPIDWIEHFKIFPETNEQRLQRLSGGRYKRETNDPAGRVSKAGAVKAAEEEEALDFYYHLPTYLIFEYRYMKVTDLICLAKETEEHVITY